MNIQQEKYAVNSQSVRFMKVVPSVGVNGDASRGFFCGRAVSPCGFASIAVGGHVVRPPGVRPALKCGGAAEGAGRAHWADLRGVLHSSRINFRSEKVCRSEKNFMVAKTALAVQPGCGRRLFAVHIQVVSWCGAPLMFKYRPGVRRELKSWGCVGGGV